MPTHQPDTDERARAAGDGKQDDHQAAGDNPQSGKVPMPASGQNSPKRHSDGVSDVGEHGRVGGGDSGGGAYPNPHTGKEARSESGGFDGGQSERDYYGSGELGGKEAHSEGSAPIDKGAGGSG